MPSANGSGEKMLAMLAHKYGLTLPGDIQTVYVGAEAPSYVAAFQKDLVDAALPFEPAGVLVQQAGKGKIYLNVMNGEIPEFRDILFMTLATHPDIMKEKPEMLRKVAQVFAEAQTHPQDRSQARQGTDGEGISEDDAGNQQPGLRHRQPDLDRDGRMSEAQAKATYAYLQPKGPAKIDFASTFTNEFLPK